MPTTSSPEPAPIAPKGFERTVETPETVAHLPHPLPMAEFGQMPVLADTYSATWNSPQSGEGQFGVATPQTSSFGEAATPDGASASPVTSGATHDLGTEAIDDSTDAAKRRWPGLKREKPEPSVSRVPMQPGLGRTIVPEAPTSKRRRPVEASPEPDDTAFDEPVVADAMTTADSRPAAPAPAATTDDSPGTTHPSTDAADATDAEAALARSVRRATDPETDGIRRDRPRRGRGPGQAATTTVPEQRAARRDRRWPFRSPGGTSPQGGSDSRSAEPIDGDDRRVRTRRSAASSARAEAEPSNLSASPNVSAPSTVSAPSNVSAPSERPAKPRPQGSRPSGSRPSSAARRPGPGSASGARTASSSRSSATRAPGSRPSGAGPSAPRAPGAARPGPRPQSKTPRPDGDATPTAAARRPREGRPTDVPAQRREAGAGETRAAAVNVSRRSARGARDEVNARPGLLARLFGAGASPRQAPKTLDGDLAERHGRHTGPATSSETPIVVPPAVIVAPTAPPQTPPAVVATTAPPETPPTMVDAIPARPETPSAAHVSDQRRSADQLVLRALGVPAVWAERLSAGDRFAGLTDVLAELPELEIDADAPLVVVVGPAGVSRLEAHRTALDLSAGWDPRPVTIVEVTRGVTDDAISALRAGVPAVVAVEVDGDGDGDALVALVQRLAPDLVIAVVDASRPLLETSRWIESLPRVDAVAVDGALEAPQPAAVRSSPQW